jgi:hypothetical protein
LLAAVDVEGGAGDRGVRHEVDGQCGDVGGADDAADRQRGTELLAASFAICSGSRRWASTSRRAASRSNVASGA